MTRFAPIALLFLAGCFNPQVQSGGFQCDPTQTPSCPAGFFCMDNRCVDHVTFGAADLATTAAEDLAGAASSNDLAHDHGGDMSQASGGGDLATGNSCAHSLCIVGVKLASGCDPCVTQICTTDSYCCVTKWSSQCVTEVTSICSRSCP